VSIQAPFRGARSFRGGTVVVLVGVLVGLGLVVRWPIAGRTTAAGSVSGGGADRSIADRALSVAANPSIVEMLDRVDRERTLDELRRLSGERPLCIGTECRTVPNRVTGGPALAWAEDYITTSMSALGYAVSIHEWTEGRWSDRNVVLRKTGVLSPTEEVYFVAHVDGVSACPAADDNGSGTVAGLEMARVFADATFARTIVFLFTSGEEQGTLGAQAYIQDQTPQALADVYVLLNLDVVGYDSDGNKAMELYHGNHGPSIAMAEVMRAMIPTYELDLKPLINPGCG